MCNPVLLLTAATAAVTMMGASSAASAQRQAGAANQQIAENNAKLADASAHDALIRGAQEQQKSAWRTRATLATQRNSAASAGIDAETGSAADILSDTALFGGVELNTITQNAAREAWGYSAQATNYRNEGAQAKWKGRADANTTILSGLGNAVGMFRNTYLGSAPGKG